MLKNQAKASRSATDWILNPVTRPRHQMPLYSDLITLLKKDNSARVIRSLYRRLFSRDLPTNDNDPRTLVECLMWAVHEELFPIDVEAMTFTFNEEVDHNYVTLINTPVLVQGEGIPLDEWGIEGLDDFIEPLVFILLPELQGELIDHPSDLAHIYRNYWIKQGVGLPKASWIHEDEWTIIHLLDQLPKPFDGLATLYKCILRATGNPFLDWSHCTIYNDFATYYAYWEWNYEGISELKHLYDDAEDDLKKLKAYYKWSHCQSSKPSEVIQQLFSLEERHIWMHSTA